LSRVAKEFNCSRTSLKKICRKNGIARWPCRQAKDARSKASSAANNTDSHECDDERDEEGSKADFGSSGSSQSSGRDNKIDSQFSKGDRDFSTSSHLFSRVVRGNITYNSANEGWGTGGYRLGSAAAHPPYQLQASRRRTAIQSSSGQQMNTTDSSYIGAHISTLRQGRRPTNGAAYVRLPPIRDTLHPPGAVQLGAVNNLRASFPPTVPFSNLDMDGTKERRFKDISQDVLRTQMTVAMKLGETRRLLKDIATLIPPDVRLMSAMEAVDDLINTWVVR